MQRYRFFHPWLMSFFSAELYRDVGMNWRGIAARYMFVLQLIVWIPLIYMFQMRYDQAIHVDFQPVIQQIPAIQVKEGALSIDKPVPYNIQDPKTGELIAVIDTSGQVTSLEQTKAQILVTKTQVMAYKDKGDRIETYNLSKVKDFSASREDVMTWLVKAKPWFMLIMYALAVLGAFIYRVIQALIYGAIGSLFAKIVKAHLTYQQCMRLALVAVTPAIIISTIFMLLDIRYPLQMFSYFILSMVYLFIAVRANKAESLATSP